MAPVRTTAVWRVGSSRISDSRISLCRVDVNPFSSNRGIPHTSGSWEYGLWIFAHFAVSRLVIWSKIPSTPMPAGFSRATRIRATCFTPQPKLMLPQ